MPVGWAIAGSAVVGAIASERASSRAERAANQSNQTARDAAQLQYDLGKETLDFQRQYYNDVLKPATERDLEMRGQVIDDYLQSSRQQRDIANEQYGFYRGTFRPVEEQVARDAMGYDSAENVNRRMGIAGAAVNQAYSNAASQQARNLSRYGINPNSSAFARANAQLTNQQALASAGAQTGAAFDTMDRGIALRAGAANFGRNMPNSSAAFFAGGDRSGGGAGATSAQGIQGAVNAVGPMLQGSGIAANAFNSMGGISNNAFDSSMRMYNAQMQGVGGLFQGIGNFAASKVGQQGLSNMGDSIRNWWNGGFGTGAEYGNMDYGMYLADGGHVGDGSVNGPGGPRDDMVPAMLSKGEFVLNEGAVKHFGLAKLNKMNEVGLQNQEARGLIRRS